jgi:hypothetical protein
MAYRNNEFTNEQIRGLQLCFIFTKKKYPFLKSFMFSSDYSNYNTNLYLDAIIDPYMCAEFFGGYFEPYDQIKIENISLTSFVYLGDYTDNNYKKLQLFGREVKEDINKRLNQNYQYLPENKQIYWGLTPLKVNQLVNIEISKYIAYVK